MKKTIAFIIGFIVLLAVIPVSADESSSISFEKAVKIIEANHKELKILSKVERDTFWEYQAVLRSSDGLDTEGMNVEIGGVKVFREFDTYTKMLMVKRKELLPEQTKYNWDMVRNKLELKRRALTNGLRGLYVELEKAYLNRDAKNRLLTLELQKNQLAKKKFDKGILSTTDFEQAGYDLNEAQKEYNASIRDWENSCRNFNLYIGVSLKQQYNNIYCEQSVVSLGSYSSIDYIQEALANRGEILSLSKQIKLKEINQDIISRNDLNKKYNKLKEEYDNGLIELEELKFKLEKAKYDIGYEIQNNYTDLVREHNTLKNTYNSLKTDMLEFAKMQSEYKQNIITKLDCDSAEIKLLIIQNQYKIDLFNYNTKVINFKNAVSLGVA